MNQRPAFLVGSDRYPVVTQLVDCGAARLASERIARTHAYVLEKFGVKALELSKYGPEEAAFLPKSGTAETAAELTLAFVRLALESRETAALLAGYGAFTDYSAKPGTPSAAGAAAATVFLMQKGLLERAANEEGFIADLLKYGVRRERDFSKPVKVVWHAVPPRETEPDAE